VGATTKLRVLLSPAVTTSEARALTVTGRLPEGVEWTGRTSVSMGGALDYLPSTRTVRWQIETLPAWTGDGGVPAIASFEVAVTPEKDAAGAPVVVLSDVAAHATDAVTGLALHAAITEVATEVVGR
jgi:hypothetical protein